MLSYHRPVSTIYHILPTKKHCCVHFWCWYSYVHTSRLWLVIYVTFFKKKIVQSSSYPMPPCSVRPEFSIYATNSLAALSIDTYRDWLLTDHLSNLMSSHHCVRCCHVSENPSKSEVLCSSPWSGILARLIFLSSSPTTKPERQPFVVLAATAYQIYWQLPLHIVDRVAQSV